MPRRTGLDTLFDNRDTPTRQELAAQSMALTAEAYGQGPYEPPAIPLDPDDENTALEGLPGDWGSFRGDRSGRGGSSRTDMDDEDYQAAIAKGIEAAENYIDFHLSPDRELAARYYRGEPFGNEIVNRSAVVMTEVRDKVLSLMPGLLRIFCGTKDAVEFINNQGTPKEQAQAQTAYINHIIHKDNQGFTIFHSAIKDALVKKTGIFQWWHEEIETVTGEFYTGLNEDAYALLQMEAVEGSSEDESVEYDLRVLRQTPDTTSPKDDPLLLGEGDPLLESNPQAAEPENFIYDVALMRRFVKKRHRVCAVPPEEFICSPVMSDNLDEFPVVGRRQMKMIGELVAMGHDEAQIREFVGGKGAGASSLEINSEATDRNPAAAERIFDTNFESVSEASEYVKYCELYILIDKDGDGILERRKVCTVGDNHDIIYDEIIDEMVPFALICPDPEPHSPFGFSVADQSMDIQEVKSEIVRGVLDSLSESIVGRTAIVEGKVNIDDALSEDRDQLIRIKEQGAIQSLSRPFNGAAAVPILAYIDEVAARRTGITISPAGLDPQALQSTDSTAAQATVDAAQERTELIARIFAETGVSRMMRGLLQQSVRHQDRKRMIRLRGKPITVDPRAFNVDLDLETNVGLGRGVGPKRLQALMFVLAQQKEAMQLLGPGNDFVGMHHISNTIEDMIQEVEINDVSRYMNPIDEAGNQKMAEAMSQPPKPTAEELMYKANAEKIEADMAKSKRADMIKLVIASMENDREQENNTQQYFIKATELLGKFGIEVNEQELQAEIARDREADQMASAALAGGQQQADRITGQGPMPGGPGGAPKPMMPKPMPGGMPGGMPRG